MKPVYHEIQRNGNSCIFADKFVFFADSLCFNAGKIFNIIFVVENKDNKLQR